MNTVFDPTMIFLSEAEWENTAIRDLFLGHLLDNLRAINDYDICRIYWSNSFECLLWSYPIIPPWRKDTDWRNQMVPVIYRLFAQRTEPLDGFEASSECFVLPPFTTICANTQFNSLFLRMIHHLISLEENIFMCIGLPNIDCPNPHLFTCTCHNFKLCPTEIKNTNDWIQYINPAEKLWPNDLTSVQIQRLRLAIEITVLQRFADLGTILYRYEFSESFLESVALIDNVRSAILFACAKRLVLTQQQASSDGGLNDEPVRGKKSKRRFRVTDAMRIHYYFSDSGFLVFDEFYPDGQHEKGL